MMLRRWLAGLTGRFRARQAERELDEEMRTHFEMAVEDNVARGMTAEEASRAARRSFGVVASVKEAHRQADSLWRSRFSADARVVGRSLRLDDQVFTIIGVMPASFRFPNAGAEFWVPLDPRQFAATRRGGRSPRVSMIARLQPDVLFDPADERVSALAPQMNPALSDGVTARLQPLNRFEGRGFSAGMAYIQQRRGAVFVLFGAVVFVLLIACANGANLFLSRTLARRREFAIRAAAGAGRLRLFRQILTESLVVSMLAGLLGLGFATWMLGLIAAAVPPSLWQNMLNPIDLDGRVVAWAALAALLSGITAALLPAFRADGEDLIAPIKGRGAGRGGGHGTLRGGLIAVQSALAVVLLVGALLMGRSLYTLVNVDVGWTAERVVALEPRFQGERYGTPESRFGFVSQLAAQLEALPGVRAAGPAEGAPFLPNSFSFDTLETDGASLPDSVVTINQVTSGYFSALDIPVLQGRVFEPDDVAQDAAIVSRDLANRLWPDTAAVCDWVTGHGSPWWGSSAPFSRQTSTSAQETRSRFMCRCAVRMRWARGPVMSWLRPMGATG